MFLKTDVIAFLGSVAVKRSVAVVQLADSPHPRSGSDMPATAQQRYKQEQNDAPEPKLNVLLQRAYIFKKMRMSFCATMYFEDADEGKSQLKSLPEVLLLSKPLDIR